jgi:hypothetical protein
MNRQLSKLDSNNVELLEEESKSQKNCKDARRAREGGGEGSISPPAKYFEMSSLFFRP